MTSYLVCIGEKEYRVRIQHGKPSIDGEALDVSLTMLSGSGMHLLRRNRQALELYFSQQDSSTYQVLVAGHRLQAKIRPAGQTARPQKKTSRADEIAAPMPGMVVEVCAAERDPVKKGDVIVVVESMKMQMQLRAAVDGCVSRVEVKAGEQVEKGQILVRLEEK